MLKGMEYDWPERNSKTGELEMIFCTSHFDL